MRDMRYTTGLAWSRHWPLEKAADLANDVVMSVLSPTLKNNSEVGHKSISDESLRLHDQV